jgi:hypothetical protein
MKRGLLSIFLIVTLVFSVASFAHAQPNITTTVEDRISLKILPQVPQPNQNISLEVSSFILDLNQANITWYINNKVFQKGLGLTEIDAKSGGVGENMTIRVVVSLNGKTYEQATSIITGSVDLIWEARSYTPPFYKGKALFPYQGQAVVAAMPDLIENGTRLNPKNLIYTWKVNGDLMNSSSGSGKSSITVEAGVITRPIEVSVTVTSVSGKTVATARTTLNYRDPQVIFYENNPLYGPLYHQALNSQITLRNKEIWVKAVPYFFSTAQIHDDRDISYQWSINNSQTTQRANTIVLRHTGTEAGKSYISAKTSNSSKILQGANSGLTINFNSQ